MPHNRVRTRGADCGGRPLSASVALPITEAAESRIWEPAASLLYWDRPHLQAKGQKMDELIDKLRALDNLDDIAALADEIKASYDDLSAGSAANSDSLNKTIADLKAEVQRLQAENYKLLTANGQDIEDPDNDTDEDEDIEMIDNLADVIDDEE